MFSNDTGLFQEAKQSKVLPNIFTAIIWAVIFLFVGQRFIGIFILSKTRDFLPQNPAIQALYTVVMAFSFVSLLVFARVKFMEKRSIASLGFHKENFLIKYLTGFLIGVGMFSGVVLLLYLTGNATINTDPAIPRGMAVVASILIVIPGWMIQSATEEILTRGWLMNVIGARYNGLIGLLVSATFFGVVHGMNPGISPLAIVNIILVGLFLGLYVIKTKNLWGACGIHAAWNWAQGNLYGFEVSGTRSAVGSLTTFQATGKSWITGGSFGPEAGIVATIVATLGIIILLILINLKDKKEA